MEHPKTLSVPAPGVFQKGLESPLSKTTFHDVQIDDSPRAGQHWLVQNVYFNFPSALKKQGDGVLGGPYKKCSFSIELIIGNVSVAKQEFIESGPAELEQEEPMKLIGTLEPFTPAIVHPGQDVHILYRINKEGTGGEVRTGTSEGGASGAVLLMNYTLVTK